MLGFKPTTSAADMLAGIKMLHMMRKGQARFAFNRPVSRRAVRYPR
jgi:hypothetical protein